MKDLLKSLIRFFRVGFLFRFLLRAYYYCFDISGSIVFGLMRVLGILPRPQPFDSSGVKSILLIRIDRIGDLVLTTPAIRAVRKKFPQARIDILVSKYARDLVLNNPHINNVLIDDKHRVFERYDLAIALHPGLRQNYIAFLSRAKYRGGYGGSGGSFFLTHKVKDDRLRMPRHELEFTLEAVRLFGCDVLDKKLELFVLPQADRFAEKFFLEHDLSGIVIFMHPGARQMHIRWNKEGFAQVADKLIKEDKVKVILSGGSDEIDLIEEIKSLMKEKTVTIPRLELSQLTALIKRSSLYLGNITGPMHIACALGVPVVAISGLRGSLDSYKFWGPWGEGNSLVLGKTDCPRCQPADCRDFSCLRSITVDSVYEAAKAQIQRLGKK